MLRFGGTGKQRNLIQSKKRIKAIFRWTRGVKTVLVNETFFDLEEQRNKLDYFKGARERVPLPTTLGGDCFKDKIIREVDLIWATYSSFMSKHKQLIMLCL